MYRQFNIQQLYFCPHNVFMCFVWIWEQTAIISLYSINWLVCITETECLLRGTDWVFKYTTIQDTFRFLRVKERKINIRATNSSDLAYRFLPKMYVLYHGNAILTALKG